MDQRAKAKRFLELHTSGRLLVLPNAWDAGSARIFEHAGFRIVVRKVRRQKVLEAQIGRTAPRPARIENSNRLA